MNEAKKVVCEANKQLFESGLVKWTSGNVSMRIPGKEAIVIKPSGVAFQHLTPEKMVIVDLKGRVVEGELKPSVDTASHLHVYRARTDVNSIVHTHSPFATSFAIRGIDLKCYTTTAANIFGEKIPCSSYAAIGEEEIGKQIVEKIGDCSAILIKNHGVFTIGKNVQDALKHAVILEEIAEYTHYAQLHDSELVPLDQETVQKANQFYRKKYGQEQK